MSDKKILTIDQSILEDINPEQPSREENEALNFDSSDGGEEEFFSKTDKNSRDTATSDSCQDSEDEGKAENRSNFRQQRNQGSGRRFSGNVRAEAEEEDFKINNDKIVSLNEIKKKDIEGLIEIAKSYDINLNRMSKDEIVYHILVKAFERGESVISEGVLSISPEDGFGFIKYLENSYRNSSYDIYVPSKTIRSFFLRTGDYITCFIKPPRKNERYFSVAMIKEVNSQSPGIFKNKVNFENLTPIFPTEKFNFGLNNPPLANSKRHPSDEYRLSISTRTIDIICPIGKGQRALIVAPPKSGKTQLLLSLANAISRQHPEVVLVFIGIDERPEEATEMQRSINGEVVCSTFDQSSRDHIAVAELALERTKRLVEQKKNVVILLDSITRLARAYNSAAPSSGKVLSGGVDSNALQRPKRFFGAARNIENGGSLTIIATALVDTGSKMDEVIFEEFKGTGNSEIVLDRKIAEQRIFPAVDVFKSGTRKVEEMVSREIAQKMHIAQRGITYNRTSVEALELLIKKINDSSSNAELFSKMN